MSSSTRDVRSGQGPSRGDAAASRSLISAELGGVEHLTNAQCGEHMETENLGRLAVTALDGVPDLFPVNYTVHHESLYITSAPGSKVMDITMHPDAAFEIDGVQSGFCWSVVIRGEARRIAIDKDIRESGVRSLISASPTAKDNYLRLSPSSISGRRFADRSTDTPPEQDQAIVKSPGGAQEPTRPYEETVQRTRSHFPVPGRPVPIAHFPPL